MLMRMYLRWAEQQGFKTEINDYQDGEEPHQVCHLHHYWRIRLRQLPARARPPAGAHLAFDQAKRRHTSFASVYVSPEIDETIQVDLKLEDLRIDTIAPAARAASM